MEVFSRQLLRPLMLTSTIIRCNSNCRSIKLMSSMLLHRVSFYQDGIDQPIKTNRVCQKHAFSDGYNQIRTSCGFASDIKSNKNIQKCDCYPLKKKSNICLYFDGTTEPVSIRKANVSSIRSFASEETQNQEKDALVNADVDGESNVEFDATDVIYDFTPPAPLSKSSQEKVQEIFDKVLYLDMIEVHLLTQVVNERMGINWKQTEQLTMGGGGVFSRSKGDGAGEVGAAAAEEEKTIFDLKLIGFDAKAKIKVIKEVRNIAGLGLKEAKELVEGAPKIVQKELKKEKAEEIKTKLESVGAQIELV